METILGITVLLVGLWIIGRMLAWISALLMNRKTRRESPRYYAHLRSCSRCARNFSDGGPMHPCPDGMTILESEVLGR